MTLLRYKQTQRLLKTYLIQVGYVALSIIYPQDVEKWNSSQSKVIYPSSYPQYLEFLINVLKKHIVHPYSSNSTLKSLSKYRIPHQGIAKDCLLLFHPTSIRPMGLRQGETGYHTCIVSIVKSKQGSKEKNVIILDQDV